MEMDGMKGKILASGAEILKVASVATGREVKGSESFRGEGSESRSMLWVSLSSSH